MLKLVAFMVTESVRNVMRNLSKSRKGRFDYVVHTITHNIPKNSQHMCILCTGLRTILNQAAQQLTFVNAQEISHFLLCINNQLHLVKCNIAATTIDLIWLSQKSNRKEKKMVRMLVRCAHIYVDVSLDFIFSIRQFN